MEDINIGITVVYNMSISTYCLETNKLTNINDVAPTSFYTPPYSQFQHECHSFQCNSKTTPSLAYKTTVHKSKILPHDKSPDNQTVHPPQTSSPANQSTQTRKNNTHTCDNAMYAMHVHTLLLPHLEALFVSLYPQKLDNFRTVSIVRQHKPLHGLNS